MALRFALAGNPNCGKTTLFNELTGSTAHVGNWPGVTVDFKEGKYKKYKKEDISIIDLPGIYSMSPYTPEEVITRNYIIESSPDVIINIVDSTNIERNLYLTTQLMEMDCPVVVALNMIDLSEREGDKIDVKGLEDRLGVPVVPISALRAEGVDKLIEAAVKKASEKRKGTSVLEGSILDGAIKKASGIVDKCGLRHPVFNGVKILENDPLVLKQCDSDKVKSELKALTYEVRDKSYIEDIEALAADLRYKYITECLTPLVIKKRNPDDISRSAVIDRVLTHKIFGIPIFLSFMLLVFHLTFGENFFGIRAIPTPGTWLHGLFESLIGFISSGSTHILNTYGASDWAKGLLTDGIIGGVGSVLSFVPQIMLLFLFLSILEDSGYMARAAFIMDKLLRRFGLSGKSFLPMLMGFGCSVPAIMAARTLASEKDRRLTMMLIPYMSCGAKMPIYAVFAAALFKNSSDFMVFGIYVIGIITAMASGILLKKTVFKGDVTPFIMELPEYRSPRVKNLLLNLWDKLKGFVLRASTVILVSTVIIWFLSSFTFSFQMVDSNSSESILGVIGGYLRYLFIPLGFGSGAEGWKAIVAILTGLIAKEAVVSTLGVLYGVSGPADGEAAGGALSVTIAAAFSVPAAVSYMAFNLLSVPCVAALSALKSEMNSARWTLLTIAFWIVTAWVISFVIFNGLTLMGL